VFNVNTKTISIKLGSQTREVVIERYTERHPWQARISIVCTFRSGTRRHAIHDPQVIEQNGRWVFPVQPFRNANRAIPYEFADTLAGNSGWTEAVIP